MFKDFSNSSRVLGEEWMVESEAQENSGEGLENHSKRLAVTTGFMDAPYPKKSFEENYGAKTNSSSCVL